MTRDRKAVAAEHFADAALLTEMADAILTRIVDEDRETYAAECREDAEQLQRISRRFRARARSEAVGVTVIPVYRAPDADPIAREAERVKAIRASLASTRYADDALAFAGPSFVGPAHAPVEVYR